MPSKQIPSSTPVTYTLRIEGLRLPSANEVLRWHRWQRSREVKRVRRMAEVYAMQQGLGDVEPLAHAQVMLTVYGSYKTDRDNIWTKDLIDAVVARPLHVPIEAARARLVEAAGGVPPRRWGLIEDDRPEVIGRAEIILEQAEEYEVVVIVEEA